jgi:hypothetical protein
MEGGLAVSISKRNSEGYWSPTEYEALTAIEREEQERNRRPFVYICSPFAGDEAKNIEQARQFCKFAVRKGATPFAPHLLYPQFMSDKVPAERELALSFGIAWLDLMDALWVFGSTVSPGMKREIQKARTLGLAIKFFTTDCEVKTS